jgi:hypothetical protein
MRASFYYEDGCACVARVEENVETDKKTDIKIVSDNP